MFDRTLDALDALVLIIGAFFFLILGMVIGIELG